MKNIEIYTWSYCPFCIRAKKILDSEGIAYKEYVIDGDNAQLQALKEKTGSGTVPQIFVEGKFYGGCDDLSRLHANGEFESIFRG